MLILGPLGFTAPLLLWGLLALPVLWLILRAVPPPCASSVWTPAHTAALALRSCATSASVTTTPPTIGIASAGGA